MSKHSPTAKVKKFAASQPGERYLLTGWGEAMPDYSAMTVNERLSAAGLFTVFDNAVQARDRARIIEVLRQVDLSAERAAQTTDAILANPERYGF